MNRWLYGQDGTAEQDADGLRVRGWLMRFGVKGTDGRQFTAESQTTLPGHDTAKVVSVQEMPILWRHGSGPPEAEPIGVLQSAEKRDDGIWVEGVLAERSQYLGAVQELLRRGALGWSSGAVEHLVKLAGNTFTRFPIVEATLTPKPRQPLAWAMQGVELSAPALALLGDDDPESKQEAMRMRIAIAEVEATIGG